MDINGGIDFGLHFEGAESCFLFNGFEWWTGREWSTDKALYKTVTAKDDTIKTLEDLHQWQKQYFETMKIK